MASRYQQLNHQYSRHNYGAPAPARKSGKKQKKQEPQAWKDFIEMLAMSTFFILIYWVSLWTATVAYTHRVPPMLTVTTVLLGLSIPVAAALSFRRCEIWYEYGALEYWQPVKDIIRQGTRRKGVAGILAALAIAFIFVVYGPFLYGAVCYVDELGQVEEHDD
ncbi:hypothetical protein BCR37DRAFT_395842 [Protomyces lactucae-debilis]|uniref:Transmembrane protein n=1 Tax=Protomyces lactucae-debilis TaxID=2754530 RepID=A0A1Y2ERA1_PROLT|nr:uncharacterized protein BCR37DRAFT_395842 [Protomyces lactucae-debilis]ORY74121.1 hypothetical protein BCR37DRAFT_395842 [Protomyces lactucae-debilis]